jgi:hypothetical protein
LLNTLEGRRNWEDSGDGRCKDDLPQLRVKRWRQQANNTEEWVSDVKKAKVLRGS